MVRRAFVLIALFGMLWAVRTLQGGFLPSQVDPLTLASIGFTALFAFTVGEVVSSLGLPRVTGYILTGVALGPFALETFSQAVVDEMKYFNTLALGLIATSAGLELDLKATLRVGRTLFFTVLTKLVALLSLVGGAFVALQLAFHPFDLPTVSATVALAVVFGVLGLGTSPAIVLAVINDSKAKGRMADLVLAIAVVKDLVVVVSLAIALAVGKVLLSPDGAFDPHVLLEVGEELGASILVGAAVGAAIWAYIRFVHAEMLLFVVAMILLVAEMTAVLHLELLLVFIVAGFLVRNFSDFEHELLHPLETVALPVFVVFFTTAGAAIDLNSTVKVLPVALTLFAGRLAALWIAGRVGGALGREDDAIRTSAWMAYVPQAGVTLGLVLLAAKALPDQGELIGTVGVALVALNLLVGPITLGTALRRGGSTGVVEAPAHEEAAAAEARPEAPPEAVPLAPPLAAALGEVTAALGEVFRADADAWRPSHDEALGRFLELTDPEIPAGQRRRALRRLAKRPPPEDSGRHAQRLHRAQVDIARILAGAPTAMTVPLEPEHLTPPAGASRWLRARVAARRIAARLRPRGSAAARVVPVRAGARVAFEGRMYDQLTAAEDARHRLQAQLLTSLERLLAGAWEADAAREDGIARADATLGTLARDADHALRRGAADASRLLHDADTPLLPLSALRLGDGEPEVTASRDALAGRPALWARLLHHQHQSLLLRSWLVDGRHRVQAIIDQRFLGPLGGAAEAVAAECQRVAEHLERIASELEEAPRWSEEQLARAAEQARQAFGRRGQHRLRAGTSRFRQQALAHQLSDDLDRLIEETPDELTVISPNTPLSLAQDPTRVEVVTVPFHAILRHQIREGLQPALLRHHAAALELVGSAHVRLTESLHVAVFALELALKGVPREDEVRPLVLDGLNRAHQRVEDFHREVIATVATLKTDTDGRLERALVKAEKEAFVRSDFAGRRLQGRSTLALARARLNEGVERAAAALLSQGRQAKGAAERVLAGRNVRALAIRSGLERLDPAQMGAWINENLPPPEALPLPSIYQRLFSLSPLDDRRFLIPHRDRPFERLQAIVAGWGQGERAAVMIRGPGGSGKTSLVNLIQLELAVERLIRVEPQLTGREEGLMAALAAELDCGADLDAVAAHITAQPTAVLIDGLERWFQPTLPGIADLERFQALLVAAGPRVLWIVTTSASALSQIDQLTACRQAFSHHISLRPFDGAGVRRAVEARHQVAGAELRFSGDGIRWWQPRRRGDAQDIYFRRLAASARWPRELIYAHALALREEGEQVVIGPARELTIPFMPHLGDEALTLLVELYRLGAMPAPLLGAHLRLGEGRVPQLVELLVTARLVERSQQDALTLTHHLRDAIAHELEAMGRLPRELL